MSFDSAERSNYGGIPTMLYEFSLGPNKWRYSSGIEDITLGADVYSAAAISDSGIIQSGDVSNDDFTVTMPAGLPFASLFLGTPPSESVYLTCRRMNRGESEAPILWVGQVRSTKRISQIAIEVVCKMLTASLNRNGLRLSWGRGCPHALYDINCRVNPADFGIAIQVQGLTGATIISSSLTVIPDGYLAGGYFEWTIMAGVQERRAIEGHTGSVLTVLGTTDKLSVSTWITVFPGCDRTSSTCSMKFNNLSNYGGFPHMPSKSPFDGDPIF